MPSRASGVGPLTIAAIAAIAAATSFAYGDRDRPASDRAVAATSGTDARLLESAPTSCAPLSGRAAQIVESRSLMIVDQRIVDDAGRTWNPFTAKGRKGGAWTPSALLGGRLGSEPGARLLAWAKHWTATDPADTGAYRPNVVKALIEPWLTLSGQGTQPDPEQLPLRLLAIVNRLDRACEPAPKRADGRACFESGPEMRFVFGLLEEYGPEQPPRKIKGSEFALILEFRLQANDPDELKRLANQWIELSELDPADDAQRPRALALLDSLTRRFTDPASSDLAVRTNESAFAPDRVSSWDLRSFKIAGGSLVPERVEQTPPVATNGTPLLSSYIRTNDAKIRAADYCLDDAPAFRAMHAIAAPAPSPQHNRVFYWQALAGTPPPSSEARFRFSLNTCSGCHHGETGTNNVHVNPFAWPTGSPTNLGPARLSPFVSSVHHTVADPQEAATCAPSPACARTRTFCEMDRRRRVLAAIAAGGCPDGSEQTSIEASGH